MYDLYSEHIYDAEGSGGDTPKSLRFARDDVRTALAAYCAIQPGFRRFRPGQNSGPAHTIVLRADLSDLPFRARNCDGIEQDYERIHGVNASAPDFAAIRATLAAFEPSSRVEPNEEISIERAFLPEGHRGVLDLRRQLVVGNRGMGKSFWTQRCSVQSCAAGSPRPMATLCWRVRMLLWVSMARTRSAGQHRHKWRSLTCLRAMSRRN